MRLRMRASQSINRSGDQGAGPPRRTPAARRSTTAPPGRGASVQRAAMLAPRAWTEVWYYRDPGKTPTSRHTLRFTETTPHPGMRLLEIDVGAGLDGRHGARLSGSMDPQNIASINHVAGGRFPRGRGVGYLLINRFAEQARDLGSTRVFLGTPIDTRSVDRAAQTVGEAEVAGERAALRVYEALGYDVATHAAAINSSRTPEQLLISTSAKLDGKWSRHPPPANCCVVS